MWSHLTLALKSLIISSTQPFMSSSMLLAFPAISSPTLLTLRAFPIPQVSNTLHVFRLLPNSWLVKQLYSSSQKEATAWSRWWPHESSNTLASISTVPASTVLRLKTRYLMLEGGTLKRAERSWGIVHMQHWPYKWGLLVSPLHLLRVAVVLQVHTGNNASTMYHPQRFLHSSSAFTQV